MYLEKINNIIRNNKVSLHLKWEVFSQCMFPPDLWVKNLDNEHDNDSKTVDCTEMFRKGYDSNNKIIWTHNYMDT